MKGQKTLWKMEPMLVTSIFTFSNIAFQNLLHQNPDKLGLSEPLGGKKNWYLVADSYWKHCVKEELACIGY